MLSADPQIWALLKDEAQRHAMPWYEKVDHDCNFFGVRGPERRADAFDDVLGCSVRVRGVFQTWLWRGTTDPGAPHLKQPMRPEGCAILVPGFYRGLWRLGHHHVGRPDAYPALVQVGKARVWRDNDRDNILDMDGPTTDNVSGLNFHRAGANSSIVGAWSACCQVTARREDHDAAMVLARNQIQHTAALTFSYKLWDRTTSPRLQALFALLGLP